jgi:hypothetical protein
MDPCPDLPTRASGPPGTVIQKREAPRTSRIKQPTPTHQKGTPIMAIVLEANYAKKLGLPGYSSHQYAVSIRTELTDLELAGRESARLYRLLQDAVDSAIQETGYLPDHQPPPQPQQNGAPPRNGAARATVAPQKAAPNGSWRCSEKQRGFIETLVRENSLEKREVEDLAQDLFGTGVRNLDKLQASGLIEALLDRCGPAKSARGENDAAPARAFANGRRQS